MPFGTFLDGRAHGRGLLWLRLTDTGYVLAGAAVDDGGGGATQTWTAGSAVPCRVDPLTGREEMTAGQVDDRSTHLITVPADTTISSRERFAIDNRGTFEITAVRERTAEWARRFEAVQTLET